MKKLYALLGAVAMMTVAHAQNTMSATLEVGDYEGATAMVEGSYFDVAPTSFYLAHTGTQMIYKAEDLAPLADLNDVKITKLTYRYSNMDAYNEMTRDIKVFMQEIDESEFLKVKNVKQFFDFDETQPLLEATAVYDLVDTYGMDGEIEFDLSAHPFALTPGKNLLVIIVMDAQDDDNCLNSGFDLQFYTTGYRHRAMTFTHNYVSFLDYKDTEDFPDASATLGCGTDVDLPVTKIDYTYTTTDAIVGDVNGDGIVDISDVNIVINVMLGKESNASADVNADENVDISDVNLVINMMLGK